MTLTNDFGTAHELAGTELGQLANDETFNHMVAIMDITVASWDTAKVVSASARSLGARAPVAITAMGLQIIGGCLTAIISTGNALEAFENEEYLVSGAYSTLAITSLVLGLAPLAGKSLMAGPIGPVIMAIIVVSLCVIAIFSDSHIVNWVKKSFWGSRKDYPYWNLKRRPETVIKQIDDAKILVNEEAKKQSVIIAEEEKKTTTEF